MGRQKGANKKEEKEEQDGLQKAIIEAIKAARDACLDALAQPIPLKCLSIVSDLAELSYPPCPSLPLAQASKLAAYCAITLHLDQEKYKVAEPKRKEIVLNLIHKAVRWARDGLCNHNSGLCAKLWMAEAFLVEQSDYRHFLRDCVPQLSQKLSDPKEDEIDGLPRRHQIKSQSGSESTAQGSSKGITISLREALKRIDNLPPLEPGMTIDHSYAACLYRLFAFSVIDHLYPPISDKDMQEQKRLATGHWQVHSMVAGSQRTVSHAIPRQDYIDAKLQIQAEPGRFRLLLNELARETLVVLDEPVEEAVAQSRPLPARSSGSSSLFFKLHQEEAASNKGRLPAAKERERKAKTVLDHWSTLGETPMSLERLVERLEVPLPLLQTHLEQLHKQCHGKGGEVPAQSAALQSAVLQDCLSSGKAHAHLSCDGQTTMPSFSSAFPAMLDQLDSTATEEQGPHLTNNTAQSLYAEVIEGKGILWEGQLPSSLGTLTRNELEQALRGQPHGKGGGASKTGSPRLMNALLSASYLKSDDADGLELEAKTPGRQHPVFTQGVDGYLHCLRPSREAMTHAAFAVEVALPFYDASNMEVVAQRFVGEGFSEGPHFLKSVVRPLVANLRAVTQESGSVSQAREFMRQPILHLKYEPMMDQDEGAGGDRRSAQLAQLCRGRLVLAMQFWLWRAQAWLHKLSWSSKSESCPPLPVQEEALHGLYEALHLTNDELLQTSHLIVNLRTDNRDPNSGTCRGAPIDEAHFCRYRFTPAEACPGSASIVHRLAYTSDSLGQDELVATGGTKDEAAAQPAQDADAANASEAAADKAHVHENGSNCGTECYLSRKWLGKGPSPVHFPETDAYNRRDPMMKEELIDEILDILEILHLSKLLSMDIMRSVAMAIIGGLTEEDADIPGANLLQITWEHMAVLSQAALASLRDNLLRCLGQHWRWTHPVRETEDNFPMPSGCFRLKPDKSAFYLAQVPAEQELIEEAMAMARAQPCSCCHPGADHASEELPGPPAHPPKQPRLRGRPEGQPHGCSVQSSGKAGAVSGFTGAGHAPDLAQELNDAFDNPHKLSKFIVEVLYGSGNKAASMLPQTTYMPKKEGEAQFQKQLRRAAACAKLAKGEMEIRDRLSSVLGKALWALMCLVHTADEVVGYMKVVHRGAGDAKDLVPLENILKEVQIHSAGAWIGAINEVKRQAEIVRIQSSAVLDMCGIGRDMPALTPIQLRDSNDELAKIRHNVQGWDANAFDAVHRLGPCESRAAPQMDKIPTSDELLVMLQQPGGRCIQEVFHLMREHNMDLFGAIAVGALALTSAEHRLGALRTAMISIQRRVEQGLKLYCGDVLQTSLVTLLSDKLLNEAEAEMEEKWRKAEELLLSDEAELEKQKMEAAAKRAAKKERQLRQKAEAQRAAEEKAAAQAAACEQAGAEGEPSQHGDAEAEGAAGEDEAEGPEVPVAKSSSGVGPKSGVQSHSLGGNPYSEDEYEEAGDDEEQKPYSGLGDAPRPPREGGPTSEASSGRGADSVEQQEASAAAAQKKKRNKADRKRAAAVRAGSLDQQHSSSGIFSFNGAQEEQDDGSEWREAKPKRSHQKRELQQQQEPQQGWNGHSERSSGHDGPPGAASARPPGDPILASINRPKPASTSRECAQCSDTSHKVMDCPQLQSLQWSDRKECCIALMDGDRERAHRQRASGPRRSCYLCDGMHDLRTCPWLQGMPEAMRDELGRAYKMFQIGEKDKVLRRWLEIRRDIQRRLPAAPSSREKSSVPSYISPTKAQQVADGTGKPQGPAQLQTAQQPRRAIPLAPEHAHHNSATSAANQPLSQRADPAAGRVSTGRTQAASYPTASSQNMRFAAASLPLQQPQSSRVQQQEHKYWNAQGAEYRETAYDSAADEAASELTTFPSPARPQPTGASYSAMAGARPAEAHASPYAGLGEDWDGDDGEETAYHQINYVEGVEPARGVPVEPGVAQSDNTFDSLMSMLRPRPTEPKGWSKVAAGDLAESAVGPTPAEAQSAVAEETAHARQEEDDMQAAIQASLTQATPAPVHLATLAQHTGQIQSPQQLAVAGPGASTPGLQNLIGEYNCFLNVVVQCLWHCREFKRRFSSLAQEDPAIVQSNDVVAGLADLFSSFDAQERQSKEEEPRVRQIVAPTRLRDALHTLDPHRFSTGEMSDAAEVLGAIYEQLADLPGIGAQATQVFELPVREAVHCSECGKDTHQNTFVQRFHCVSATALRLHAMLALADNEGLLPPLGELLLGIDAQDQKTCDTDEGGCGRLTPIQRFLEGAPPPVFTLQLAWESHAEGTEAITEVLNAIQEEVDIGEMYKALGSKEFRLHSMVCYYGKHYHAFVRTEGRWVAFDDATLNQVGGWENVVKKCALGRIQPSLLFYEEALGG